MDHGTAAWNEGEGHRQSNDDKLGDGLQPAQSRIVRPERVAALTRLLMADRAIPELAQAAVRDERQDHRKEDCGEGEGEEQPGALAALAGARGEQRREHHGSELCQSRERGEEAPLPCGERSARKAPITSSATSESLKL